MAEVSRKRTNLALSAYRYPRGWFQVGWSDDVPVGTVQALRYFGKDLVCWRGEDGQINVLDAYCRHLGAHLGVKGRVDGNDIQCPWHGWRWNGEGRNTLIPYSAQRCKDNVRIEKYRAIDWYGRIIVWHDWAGETEPAWQPPPVPELDGEGAARFYPLTSALRTVHRIRVHPQMIVENAADPYHVEYVHGAGEPATTLGFEVDGHHLHATIKAVFGAGKESTWLTPNGRVDTELVYDTYGIGLGFVRFPAEIVETLLISGHTPVDDEYTDYFMSVIPRRDSGDAADAPDPSGRTGRWVAAQHYVVTQDFFTWENMQHLPSPAFAPEEARDYAALRRWAHQFYPPESIPDTTYEFEQDLESA